MTSDELLQHDNLLNSCFRKFNKDFVEFVEKRIKEEKPKSNIVFIFFVVYPLRLVKHLQ